MVASSNDIVLAGFRVGERGESHRADVKLEGSTAHYSPPYRSINGYARKYYPGAKPPGSQRQTSSLLRKLTIEIVSGMMGRLFFRSLDIS